MSPSKDNPVGSDMENALSNITKGVDTRHMILLQDDLFPWQQRRMSVKFFTERDCGGLKEKERNYYYKLK